MGKTEKEIEEFIIKSAQHDSLTTWWMSNFYEDFCKLMGYNFENIKKNGTRIRYYLNKLVKKGILISKSGGTGYIGKTDYGMTYNKNWILRSSHKN